MTLSDSRHSLTMILPALNEEANIQEALERVVTALEQHVASFEVLVINDGSTDRTGEIAEEFARSDQRVRVLHNERNVNYGISLARGIGTVKRLGQPGQGFGIDSDTLVADPDYGKIAFALQD